MPMQYAMHVSTLFDDIFVFFSIFFEFIICLVMQHTIQQNDSFQYLITFLQAFNLLLLSLVPSDDKYHVSTQFML